MANALMHYVNECPHKDRSVCVCLSVRACVRVCVCVCRHVYPFGFASESEIMPRKGSVLQHRQLTAVALV